MALFVTRGYFVCLSLVAATVAAASRLSKAIDPPPLGDLAALLQSCYNQAPVGPPNGTEGTFQGFLNEVSAE